MKRLSSQTEFDELKKHGIRKRTPYFDIVTITHPRDGDFGFAIIVSKKTGNAVKRNKIKRWFKNFAHLHAPLFKADQNYLVICKKGIFEYGRENIYNDLTSFFESSH